MPRYLKVNIICILFLAFSVPASSELYQYKDENGITRLTDNIYSVPIEFRSQLEQFSEIDGISDDIEIQPLKNKALPKEITEKIIQPKTSKGISAAAEKNIIRPEAEKKTAPIATKKALPPAEPGLPEKVQEPDTGLSDRQTHKSKKITIVKKAPGSDTGKALPKNDLQEKTDSLAKKKPVPETPKAVPPKDVIIHKAKAPEPKTDTAKPNQNLKKTAKTESVKVKKTATDAGKDSGPEKKDELIPAKKTGINTGAKKDNKTKDTVSDSNTADIKKPEKVITEKQEIKTPPPKTTPKNILKTKTETKKPAEKITAEISEQKKEIKTKTEETAPIKKTADAQKIKAEKPQQDLKKTAKTAPPKGKKNTTEAKKAVSRAEKTDEIPATQKTAINTDIKEDNKTKATVSDAKKKTKTKDTVTTVKKSDSGAGKKDEIKPVPATAITPVAKKDSKTKEINSAQKADNVKKAEMAFTEKREIKPALSGTTPEDVLITDTEVREPATKIAGELSEPKKQRKTITDKKEPGEKFSKTLSAPEPAAETVLKKKEVKKIVKTDTEKKTAPEIKTGIKPEIEKGKTRQTHIASTKPNKKGTETKASPTVIISDAKTVTSPKSVQEKPENRSSVMQTTPVPKKDSELHTKNTDTAEKNVATETVSGNMEKNAGNTAISEKDKTLALAQLQTTRELLAVKKETLNQKYLDLMKEKQLLEKNVNEDDEKSVLEYNENVKKLNIKIKQYKKEKKALQAEIETYNHSIRQLRMN